MAFRIICLVSICLAVSTVVISQERGWRGIVPLQSTRADVEKLLGRSTERSYGATYDLGDEAVTFEYSSCRCCKPIENRWNVREYTVIRIRISAAVKPLFSGLKIDRAKFEKVDDSHLPDVLYFRNRDEGVSFEVQDDVVITTEYGPSAKDDKALRCANRVR